MKLSLKDLNLNLYLLYSIILLDFYFVYINYYRNSRILVSLITKFVKKNYIINLLKLKGQNYKSKNKNKNKNP